MIVATGVVRTASATGASGHAGVKREAECARNVVKGRVSVGRHRIVEGGISMYGATMGRLREY